ncbi:MAG: hypothetical protein JXR37_20040 [Kiritimatiellae bacterium]|nr:hypothetical protein [Kiritimatiellia bacterium]
MKHRLVPDLVLFLLCLPIAISSTVAAEPAPGDYDGDGQADLAVYSELRQEWMILESSTGATNLTAFPDTPLTGELHVPKDYDGDGRTDLGVYDAASGTWYMLQSSNGYQTVQFGWSETEPIPEDYDGDGLDDTAVFHGAAETWYLMRSRDGFQTVTFGADQPIPVPADYDGDTNADIAVYSAASGTWHVIESSTGATNIVPFSWPDPEPVPADYDGDGKADVAVYSASGDTWHIFESAVEQTNSLLFGWPNTEPAPADYDGDGRADCALFCRTNAMWYILRSSDGQTNIQEFGWAERTLVVTGDPEPHGSPSGFPAAFGYGTNDVEVPFSFTNFVTSPADTLGGTQHVCTGWSGTGSITGSGTGTSVEVTMTTDSTLTWQWEPEYLLDTEAGPNGSVDTGDGWYSNGASVTISAAGTNGFRFWDWAGDVPGGSETNNPLTLTMDRARTVTANFKFGGPVFYVDLGASGQNDGSSWADAFTNIQAALDIAFDGETVLVTNGTYNLAAQLAVSRGVTVRSVNGPDQTTIHGNYVTRCLYLDHADAVVDGFTIMRGTAFSGPGVYLNGGGTVTNCTIRDNDASGNGAGVYCAGGGTVVDCTLNNNEGDEGGGVYCDGGGTILNCVIRNNVSAGSWGGAGVYCAYGGMIRNCVLSGNQAWNDGGGVYCDGGGTIENCTIIDNEAGAGGGVCCRWGGTVRNSVIYSNSGDPDSENWDSSGDGISFVYSCTVPLVGGDGNVTNNPQFVNELGGNYRLRPDSPCVDAGANLAWMFGAADLDGNARIFNGTADMGAYEVRLIAQLHAFLQGPYNDTTHAMTCALYTNSLIPLTSPYADDRREVTAAPSNATDWVLVQLLDAPSNAPVVSRSAFLDTDGNVIADDGSAGAAVEVAAGSYYVRLAHRNHAALMSAAAVPFTNETTAYDFTTGAGQAYGGAASVVEVEPGIWGMIAGDADGDGAVLAVDALIHASQTNLTGYHRADFNLDGTVSDEDLTGFWTPNEGRATAVPNPATWLSPALEIRPPHQTLVSGYSNTFYAVGSTGDVAWAFVTNPSGGSLTVLDGTSVVYQAGVTSACIDVIEAWDAEDRVGRANVNVIGTADIAAAGKAVVLAGRKSADDPLWPNSDYLADAAYNTLLYRGYSKPNIHYLSPELEQDVDGDGIADDIDLETTYANAELTFTNWANGTSNLFVYLVDHGTDSAGNGQFRLNASDTLPAADLDGWLDSLQDAYGTRVIVLIDCCYAGSLLDELAYPGPADRIVMASCGTNGPAYFVAGGLVSFSDAFLNGVLLADDVADAYAMAANAMGLYQAPVYYDNGGGGLGTGLYLGATFIAAKEIPRIGTVCGNQLLSGETTATLWGDDVTSQHPITRVWCHVVPPSHDPEPGAPIDAIPELTLPYEPATGRYTASYAGFSEQGAYKVIYYARDEWNSVSLPEQRYVIQQGFDERVVLVNGGLTNAARWPAMNAMANRAYHTCLKRWFDGESIRYMSAESNQDVNGDGTNDVDATPSLVGLAAAVTNWAGAADKLTVYLIGENDGANLRLNASQTLDAPTLDGWLDAFQTSNNAPAIVILEFPGAGGFVPALTPPAGCERITIAGAEPNKDCSWAVNGQVSFSGVFLSHVFNGRTVGDAFEAARTCMRAASGRLRQTAQLDDDGDGVPNEAGQDGLIAEARYIGAAFITGDENPAIGTPMPDASFNEATNSLTLWAADVTDMDGVSTVWCTVTEPDFDGAGELPQTNLMWNAGAGRHEVLWDAFTKIGDYVVTFFAEDTLGELSEPAQCIVTRFEQDTDADQMPDWWETLYFAGVTNADAATDDDGDTYSNWAEWLAGSDPTNGASMFEIADSDPIPADGYVILRWPSLSNRVYSVDVTTNLSAGFAPFVSNLVATPAENVYTDDQHAAEGLLFYRVRVGQGE